MIYSRKWPSCRLLRHQLFESGHFPEIRWGVVEKRDRQQDNQNPLDRQRVAEGAVQRRVAILIPSTRAIARQLGVDFILLTKIPPTDHFHPHRKTVAAITHHTVVHGVDLVQ